MAEDLLARYTACRGRTSQALWRSLDAAASALTLDGTVSTGQARGLRDCASRDLSHLASVLVRGTREEIAAAVALGARPGALRSMLQALRLSGDAVFRLAGDVGHAQRRRAGEVTCAGSLTCARCAHARASRGTTSIAMCPGCGHAESYKILRA